MRLERADRLRREALGCFRDLARQTVFYGFPHEEYLKRYDVIRRTIDKCPSHVKNYLSGYVLCHSEKWYETELAYCHRAPDGQFYTMHKGAIAAGIALDVDVIYRANRGCEIPTWESAHYWLTASVREAQYGRPAKRY